MVRHEVDGKVYGVIPSWHLHQAINNREAASDLPAPPEEPTRVASVDVASATPLEHAPVEGKAASFDAILKKTKAKFVLGLTATPIRRDGQQPIIFMQCSPTRHTAARPANAQHDLEVLPRSRFARIDLPSAAGIQDVFRHLANDLARTQAIAAEVVAAFAQGRKVLAACIANTLPRPMCGSSTSSTPATQHCCGCGTSGSEVTKPWGIAWAATQAPMVMFHQPTVAPQSPHKQSRLVGNFAGNHESGKCQPQHPSALPATVQVTPVRSALGAFFTSANHQSQPVPVGFEAPAPALGASKLAPSFFAPPERLPAPPEVPGLLAPDEGVLAFFLPLAGSEALLALLAVVVLALSEADCACATVKPADSSAAKVRWAMVDVFMHVSRVFVHLHGKRQACKTAMRI